MPTLGGSGFTVLVIDDDEMIRHSFCTVFEEEGFATQQAENGRVALALLDALPRPAAVVLDLMMPVMDGREFLRRLREGPHRDLPVVVVSAFVERDVEELADATLAKPVRATTLLATIARMLAREEAS